jgi:hypothetical protein
VKRVSGVAGVEARLVATGQTFAEVAAERLGEAASVQSGCSEVAS